MGREPRREKTRRLLFTILKDNQGEWLTTQDLNDMLLNLYGFSTNNAKISGILEGIEYFCAVGKIESVPRVKANGLAVYRWVNV